MTPPPERVEQTRREREKQVEELARECGLLIRFVDAPISPSEIAVRQALEEMIALVESVDGTDFTFLEGQYDEVLDRAKAALSEDVEQGEWACKVCGYHNVGSVCTKCHSVPDAEQGVEGGEGRWPDGKRRWVQPDAFYVTDGVANAIQPRLIEVIPANPQQEEGA